MIRGIVLLITLIQMFLALQFVRRVWRTRNGERIERSGNSTPVGQISVVVPVLNEASRIGPCLESLILQGDRVREILVVDGGSSDGTRELVRRFTERDSRISLLRAGPIASGWNGKAFGLQAGIDAISETSTWLVTIDADVRVAPEGISQAVGFAEERGVPVLSVATAQVAKSPGLLLVHPSLLTSLVYRFGIPGHLARALDEVQANGQFAVYQREALVRAGGLTVARDSICEDVTLARHLFQSGHEVGFYEGVDIAATEMYPDALSCLRNWPRSLSLRDRFAPDAGLRGLLNIAFLQVLPVVAQVWIPDSFRVSPTFSIVNRILLGMRIGILAGTRRAYKNPSPTYWLSPLADPLTLAVYAFNLVRRNHEWRGRQLVIRES